MGAVGVAPSTVTLQLPDGTAIALADWIDDKFYGTVQLNNGQNTPVICYSASRSQPVPGGTRIMTRVDTNIPRQGDNGLPKDWEMLVYGIGIKMVRVQRAGSNADCVLGDVNGALSAVPRLNTLFQIDRVTYFQYIYNGKQYSDGVITDYPQGGGYGVFSTNTVFELAQNGIPSPRDRIALVLPIHERENLGYQAVFQPEVSLVIAQPPGDELGTLDHVDIKVYKWGSTESAPQLGN